MDTDTTNEAAARPKAARAARSTATAKPLKATGTTRHASVGANPTAARKRRPRKPKAGCADCFFKRNLLCSLDAPEPCPTFRHHEQGLKPPRQLSFVFRQERTRAAWVFEQRND